MDGAEYIKTPEFNAIMEFINDPNRVDAVAIAHNSGTIIRTIEFAEFAEETQLLARCEWLVGVPGQSSLKHYVKLSQLQSEVLRWTIIHKENLDAHLEAERLNSVLNNHFGTHRHIEVRARGSH